MISFPPGLLTSLFFEHVICAVPVNGGYIAQLVFSIASEKVDVVTVHLYTYWPSPELCPQNALLTQMTRSEEKSDHARETVPPSTPKHQVRNYEAIPPSSNRSFLSSVVDLFQQAKTNATSEFDQLYHSFSVPDTSKAPQSRVGIQHCNSAMNTYIEFQLVAYIRHSQQAAN